jgi:pimeloyl-ACP methyl ester carboxylesterase
VIFLWIVVALLLAGGGYQILGGYLDARRFRAPGRFVEAGGSRLHLHERGSGRPAVILEAGIAGSSLGWALVQPAIAAFTKACSYDRAGLGFSGKVIGPRTVEQMTSDLRALLTSAGTSPPYILVGHSFGGLLIRAYANFYPQDVAGLVFVDPVCLCTWADCGTRERNRLAVGVRLSRRGSVLARLGIVRLALTLLVSGGRWLPKLIGRAAAGQGTGTMERLIGEVRKLPREAWPVIQSHWCNPKNFRAMAAYLECLPESARAARVLVIPPEIPFTVLSAGNATEAELRERDSWVEQSGCGKHVRVQGAGHWIQLERPDVVVEAVLEFVKRKTAIPIDRPTNN